MKCIVCKSGSNKVVFNESNIDIYRCNICGHIFSSYRRDQYYDGYFGDSVSGNDNFWWNQAHQKMYDDFFKRFIKDRSGKLLDVGCGLGFFIKKAGDYPNWQALGYEISKVAVEYARNDLKLDNIICGKVEEANFLKNYFDIITLWDVIEHIPDPDKTINYLNSILKDDGILFIHTPNAMIQLFKARIKKLVYGVSPEIHYLEAKDHLNIYSMKTISIILKRNNFHSIKFINFHPIQSISGSRKKMSVLIKNLWYYSSRLIYWLSFNKINLNNLYIVAQK